MTRTPVVVNYGIMERALREALEPHSAGTWEGASQYELGEHEIPDLAKALLVILAGPKVVAPEDEKRTGREDGLNVAD